MFNNVGISFIDIFFASVFDDSFNFCFCHNASAVHSFFNAQDVIRVIALQWVKHNAEFKAAKVKLFSIFHGLDLLPTRLKIFLEIAQFASKFAINSFKLDIKSFLASH